MDFNGKSVLVTGASRGIGRAIALEFAGRSARVARPEDVAYVVAFLASDGVALTTGTIIDVNGASYLRT